MRVTLIPHLKQNIETALAAGPAYESLFGWTSNNSEAINSVVKHALDHKQHQLQQLIDKICKEVYQGRLLNLKRAVVGLSDYKLIPEFANLRIQPDKWSQLDSAQQDRHFKKLLEKRVPISTRSMIESTNGKLIANYPKNGGKKPGIL